MKLIKYIIPLILFFGCDTPDKVDKQTLGKAYVDILVAQEIYLPNYDSLNIEKTRIFNKYDITEEDYNYTLDSYKDNEEEWEEFFKQSLAYLDTLKKYKGK